NIITKFSVWLIKGTPIVVLLMILYYIIFGKVDISGIWVAVIAFSLTFGTSVYRMLTFGTGALDRGQTEAAYALGYTDLQTFFTIILPQAALHFMPSLREEVTMLIKSTAVVGYIAVQDLTKMGDIVRSRTYEAFFPLIAVAIIYFILAGLLNAIVLRIHWKITPSMRKPEDILRGINLRGDSDHD
ncbi:MAG: ABC transporter permease subunit, partial [Synergistaceae bacterium]|nr:ABC transporter permease subunit [Synergistaceae bacterium]